MNSGEESTEEPGIAHLILAYLHANPEAQDTVEGIVEWWLLEQKIRRQTESVQQALDELTAQGLITARLGQDSRVHYSIERNKTEEIEKLLKEPPTR